MGKDKKFLISVKMINRVIRAINVAGFKLIYGKKIEDFYLIANYELLESNEKVIRSYKDIKKIIK